MALTRKEQQLLTLIRDQPLATPEELAQQLGSTRAAVNVHVSNLVRKGALLGRGYILPEDPDRSDGRIVVVGGANVDLKARTSAPALPGTSNPGVTEQAPGGVGRNIAENLARLGVPVSLITAVGRDALGDTLLHDTQAAGVDVSGVLRVPGETTGTYTAILNDRGEMLIAVAAMGVMARLTPAALRERRRLLRGADWVVADGNLPEDTLVALLGLCHERGLQVVFEPVSVPKARHLHAALEAGLAAPQVLTPNVGELGALLGQDVPDRLPDLKRAARALLDRGAQIVWVRRGRHGSLLCTPGRSVTLPALPATPRDVTGAGDAMLAAFMAGLTQGLAPEDAARLGHAAAALTIEHAATVVPDLTLDLLQRRLNS
ncbi:PfkB family carbohydrate kinase [Deinococcus ficus]|uniref:PfkB family carbohydrate kinase n=1 Tax=Deinococcus ficus TaxID=317577 RepID=UPI0003B3E0F0|nr:PfkB family carbohydrate kinase [Deinococcus ficus]